MKKLFAMILMLSVSATALSEEVKLLCTLKNGRGNVTHEKYTFDAQTGEVSHQTKNGTRYWSVKENSKYNICVQKSEFPCIKVFISDTSVRMFQLSEIDGEKSTYDEVLDRIDGSFKSTMDGSLYLSGTCAPFKAAF